MSDRQEAQQQRKVGLITPDTAESVQADREVSPGAAIEQLAEQDTAPGRPVLAALLANVVLTPYSAEITLVVPREVVFIAEEEPSGGTEAPE